MSRDMDHLETSHLVVSSKDSSICDHLAVGRLLVEHRLEGTVWPTGIFSVRDDDGAFHLENSLHIEVYNGGKLNEGFWESLKEKFGLTCACTCTVYHPGHPDYPEGWTDPPHCIEEREECKRV